MTSVEQHKIVAELRDYESKMTRSELELFTMFRKRDKDDEDLDEISKKKLLELHKKYVIKERPKINPLDSLFKK